MTVTVPAAPKVHESTELPEPPVTVVGVTVHAALSDTRATSPVNPFNGDIVMVEVAGTPTVADTLVGLAAMVKSGAGVTVTLTVVEAVLAPKGEPLTVRVKAPVGVSAEVEIVKRLDPVGVTGLVAKLQLTPAGRGVAQDSVTGSAEPASNVAVMVTVPELPCVILTGPSFDNE